MIRINLLPHRAAKRALLKREFNFLLLFVLIGAAAAWYIGKLYWDERNASQLRRNEMLIAENKALDAKIVEIKKLREQTSQLLSRKQVVETLQTNRSTPVKILDQLVRQLPEGVYLRSVKQTGNKVNVVGLAQSQARISTLMRNLDASPYLMNAELIESKAVTGSQRANEANLFEFSLNTSLKGLEDPNAKKAAPAPVAAAAPSSREKAMQAITK